MHLKISIIRADFNVIVFLPSRNPPPKSKRYLVLLLRQQHAHAPSTREDGDLAGIRAHKIKHLQRSCRPLGRLSYPDWLIPAVRHS